MERTEDASRENRASVVRDEEAVARFVERFALTFSEAGVPRMPARVFSALLVSDEGRRTASELAETLKVSPAAVSNAVRYLTQVGLVARDAIALAGGSAGRDRSHRRRHPGWPAVGGDAPVLPVHPRRDADAPGEVAEGPFGDGCGRGWLI